MSINVTCPDCNASYKLADDMLGKKVRCKSCSEVFLVRDESFTSNRYDDDDRPPPPRRPRKKSSRSSAVPWIIGGGIAAGVLVLVGFLVLFWAVGRVRQAAMRAAANGGPPPGIPQPDFAPPRMPAGFPPGFNDPPAMPNPDNANPPAAGGQQPDQGANEVQLSNGQVSGFGAQMQVQVSYRFNAGNPGGRRLFLLIKATKAGGLRQSYYLAQLHTLGNKTEGTIAAQGMSFGIEHGPFEMFIGEAPPGIGIPMSDREIKKISNVVTVATKQFAPPGRPPIGPRRGRP